MVSRTAALAIVALLLASSRAATQERVPADPPASADKIIGLTTPSDVRVEWLELVPQKGMRVVASRDYAAVDRLSLAVPAHPNTYLRFFRGTSSPITVLWDGLPTKPGATLPPVMPGGEIFVTIEPATVTPESFQIEGTHITIKPDKDPAFSLMGLADGRYTIKPAYVGGRVGAEIGVDVRSGKTTDVFVRQEAVGAAAITAEGLRCQFMDSIRVWREDSRKKVTEETTYPVDRSTCSWQIAGLPIGWYLVSAVAHGGRGPIMTFEIVEQKVTTVSIEEPPVRVTGRVTHNGLPVSDATIALATKGERALDVRTDANGEFAAALPVPGWYFLMLKGADSHQIRPETLDVGDNYVDWAIGNTGTVRVTAEGFDLSSNILVRIENRQKRVFSSRILEPGAEVSFSGLPYGTYVLAAVQGTLRSKLAQITIDTRHDTHDVKITPQ